MSYKTHQRSYAPWEKVLWRELWLIVDELKKRGYKIHGPWDLSKLEGLWALKTDTVNSIKEWTIEVVSRGFKPDEKGKQMLWPYVVRLGRGNLSMRQGIVGRWFDLCKLVAMQRLEKRQPIIEALEELFQRPMPTKNGYHE